MFEMSKNNWWFGGRTKSSKVASIHFDGTHYYVHSRIGQTSNRKAPKTHGKYKLFDNAVAKVHTLIEGNRHGG